MHYSGNLIFINGFENTPIRDIIWPEGFYVCNYSSSSQDMQNIVFMKKVEFRLLMAIEDPNERKELFPEAEGNEIVTSIGSYDFYFNDFISEQPLDIQVKYENRFKTLTELADLRQTSFPLLNIYTLLKNKKNDWESARHLARHFGISVDDVFEDFKIPGHSKWSLYNHSETNDWRTTRDKIIFNDKNGLPIFTVRPEHFENAWSLLPETTWIRKGFKKPLVFNIMPCYKYPLFNLEAIAHINDKNIFLTDYTFWAKRNLNSRGGVWTSWYGGLASIKHVDWRPLRGRKVFYLINISFFHKKEQIEIAFELYTQLVIVENIDFQLYRDDSSGYSKIFLDDLILLADHLEIPVPDSLRRNTSRFIRGNSIDQIIPSEFIVEPVIKKRNLVILYAPSGVGKSWLGLSIGLAVANGVDVFWAWRVPSGPQKVYYVLGEMDEDEIKSRVAILKKIYQNETQENNYFNMRRDQFDLASEEGQRKIELDIKDLNAEPGGNVSLLVLDNLSTLVKNGDYPSNWNALFNWLEKLKKKGITILLIHHANKEGDFLGTSGIKNKTDFLIHASNKDEIEEGINKIKKAHRAKSKRKVTGEDLEREIMCYLHSRFNPEIKMYLAAKKLRSSSKNDVYPLVISLEPDSQYPKWEVTANRHYVSWRQHSKNAELSCDSFEEYSDDIDNDEVIPEKEKLLPPPKKSILKMKTEDKAKWIRRCYFEGVMTTEKMSKFFGVSVKSIYNIRKETNTKVIDLKGKAGEESERK